MDRRLTSLFAGFPGLILLPLVALSSQIITADSMLPSATYYESAARQGVGPYNGAGTDSDKVGTVRVINPATGINLPYPPYYAPKYSAVLRGSNYRRRPIVENLQAALEQFQSVAAELAHS